MRVIYSVHDLPDRERDSAPGFDKMWLTMRVRVRGALTSVRLKNPNPWETLTFLWAKSACFGLLTAQFLEVPVSHAGRQLRQRSPDPRYALEGRPARLLGSHRPTYRPHERGVRCFVAPPPSRDQKKRDDTPYTSQRQRVGLAYCCTGVSGGRVHGF